MLILSIIEPQTKQRQRRTARPSGQRVGPQVAAPREPQRTRPSRREPPKRYPPKRRTSASKWRKHSPSKAPGQYIQTLFTIQKERNAPFKLQNFWMQLFCFGFVNICTQRETSLLKCVESQFQTYSFDNFSSCFEDNTQQNVNMMKLIQGDAYDDHKKYYQCLLNASYDKYKVYLGEGWDYIHTVITNLTRQLGFTDFYLDNSSY